MSEFSNSLHLRTTHRAEGVALLRKARVAGFVFSSTGGWVAMAYDEGRIGHTDALDRLVEANTGLLVHYDYAADHGCRVDVYKGPMKVARIGTSFETKGSLFDREAFVSLKLFTPAQADTVAHWVKAHKSGGERYVVARALGLTKFAWFSYHYETSNPAGAERERVAVEAQEPARLTELRRALAQRGAAKAKPRSPGKSASKGSKASKEKKAPKPTKR